MDHSKELTYKFCTSCMNSPTLSTSLAAAGNAARSTPLGEPSAGASLFMTDAQYRREMLKNGAILRLDSLHVRFCDVRN
jgi:hypothetical protein